MVAERSEDRRSGLAAVAKALREKLPVAIASLIGSIAVVLVLAITAIAEASASATISLFGLRVALLRAARCYSARLRRGDRGGSARGLKQLDRVT
jgi:hypothetical protein